MAAAQKVTAGMVTDCQRIAAVAVSCAKMTLEIRTPYLVAVMTAGQRQFCRRSFATTFTPAGQTLLIQKQTYRGDGGVTIPAWSNPLEARPDFGRAPLRKASLYRKD